ncbi:MAG: hypothetical protein A2074_00055 [Candidatus Aquicultor primus]|uniref:Uncharacterized protein n=1 Tax=Candidatus Aquicultor primus TaxID=1797195 RepID=A0A1F2UIU8_9ACTN|nr:MAG: hypothetical protein A2074_00055 [Candidatus Aquicultor primus]HCG98297.1 hypothetical protein [Actinomycetota bacterium]
MAKKQIKSRKKPYLKVIILGLISIALYVAIFTNEVYVRETWALGGVYAALPIITVFIFSFIYGSFANYVFVLLGIEAKKK